MFLLLPASASAAGRIGSLKTEPFFPPRPLHLY
jgi:hypothetical protein